MENLGHNLAAVLLIAAATVLTGEARRRWGPWRTMPADGSRLGRWVKFASGVAFRTSSFCVVLYALFHWMHFDTWAFVAGLTIGMVADGFTEALWHRPS